MNKNEWIIIILLITIASMSFIIRDLNIAVNSSKTAPTNDYVYITSNCNSYYLLSDSEVFAEKTDLGWYVVIDNINGRKIIECLDDDIATAEEWKDSILMSFDRRFK